MCPLILDFPLLPHLFSALPTMSLINEYRVAKMGGGGGRSKHLQLKNTPLYA